MRILHAAVLLAFLLAVGAFVVQNTTTVTVTFLGWSVRMPLALLALLIYALGMLTGWGVVSFVRRSLRAAARAPKQQ